MKFVGKVVNNLSIGRKRTFTYNCVALQASPPRHYLIINIKMSTLGRDPTWTITKLETQYDTLHDIHEALKDLHDRNEVLCEHYRKGRDKLYRDYMAFLSSVEEKFAKAS